jgi:radical SAM superfamily enzyme YgiQ (UPF0313 family)
MAVTKILFAFYPIYVSYNHGIAVLSSLCRKCGIDVDVYLLDNVDKFNTYINENEFSHIAFSCVTKYDYLLSLPFMQVASDGGRTTMLGGVFPRLPVQLHAPVDIICRGEGEMLPLFLLEQYTGLFRSQELYPDLNRLPMPDYELFQDIAYDRVLPFDLAVPALPYSSSRGCAFRCNFCAVSLQPAGVRIRTKVEEDLKLLTDKYNPGVIHFLDELIPYYNEEWRESWGDFQFPFVSYIRADITEKQLRWLKDKGLAGCFFGIESGSEEYRNKVLGKNLTNKQIYNTVEQLKEMGVPYMASYMRGMPGETWEMQADTLELADTVSGYSIFYAYENLLGV